MNTRRLRRLLGRPAALAVTALTTIASVGLGPTTASAVNIPQATFVDFAQCANNAPPSTSTGCPGGWINGILQQSNSHYAEDQVTPQRLEVSVPQGSPATNRTITIEYQDRKGNAHAYDSLGTWNYTQTTADRCAGLAANLCVGGNPSTLAIPYDCTEVPTATLPGIAAQAAGCGSTTAYDVTARHQLAAQNLVMYGGALDSVSSYSHSSATPAGTDDYTDVTITYHVDATALSAGNVLVQLLFGGHSAPGVRDRGWGVALGASSISGGPYHFKFLQTDGQSIGNRDNQISAGSILAAPTISTNLSATSVPIGTAVHDSATLTDAVPSAGGTVTYTAYNNNTCSSGAQAAGTVTVTNGAVPDSNAIVFTTAGTYYWQAVYSGDAADEPATSPCGSEIVTVSKATPGISTTLSATSVAIGELVHDTATLSGASPTAGGTVTYTVFSNTACTTQVANAGTVTVTNGVVPNSTAISFSSAGTYYWQAAYSGDTNDAAATSACTSEIVTVNPNSPTIATTLSASSVTVGASVHDTATLTGATANAGGTVTYTVFSNSACTTGAQSAGTKTVTNGVVPNSDPITFNSAGTYYWQAAYSGDLNNHSTTSACTSEVLTVNRTTPSIATVLSATSVAIGAQVHDTATLSGATGTAGGTVTYTVFSNNQCSSVSANAGTKTVTNGVVPNSDAVSFNAAGTYYWQAAYSGDANNAPATSPCTSEVLTVTPNTPGISTQLSATSAAIGALVHDSATLSGATSNAGGSVTYTVFSDSQCSVQATGAGTKTVTNGVVPNSDAVSFNSAGTYYWQAAYTGDANNGAATSPCTSEILTVNPNSPSISTQLSSTSAAIGAPVHDTATLSGATGNAGGTVTYTVYSNNTCDIPTKTAGTKTVLNGLVPNSDAVTFNAAGTYYWQAVYSGDANNNGATSPCTSEIVTINANSPTISTQLSTSSAAIGAPVHDSATLSGATSNAGGTVTYTVYSDNECSIPTKTAGTKTVLNGLVPNSDAVSFSSAGTYYWQAAYSGDANNNGTLSPCESEILVIDPNAPSIATTLSASSVGIGDLVHDTATLSAATANAGGTVTYTVYSNSACTTLVKSAGVKTVTNGIVPNSDAVSFTGAGTYYWQAAYSGDANNALAVSPCTSEVLTVSKSSPSISTAPNVASGTVGIAIHDVATLSGGSNPTGTVTFALYGPGDMTCATNLVANQSGFTVSTTNGAATSPDFTTTDVGVYQWVATYNGDANNKSVSGACGDTTEQVVTAAVLAEVSLPPTGSLPLALLLSGIPLLALGAALLALGRRRRRQGQA